MGSYPQCLVNADALSRLPRAGYHTAHSDCLPGELIQLLDHMSITPLTPVDVRNWTEKDPICDVGLAFIMSGWTVSCTPSTGLHLSAHTLAGLLILLIHCVKECCHQKFSSALGGGGGGGGRLVGRYLSSKMFFITHLETRATIDTLISPHTMSFAALFELPAVIYLQV